MGHILGNLFTLQYAIRTIDNAVDDNLTVSSIAMLGKNRKE